MPREMWTLEACYLRFQWGPGLADSLEVKLEANHVIPWQESGCSLPVRRALEWILRAMG